jgi:hypothetical protein
MLLSSDATPAIERAAASDMLWYGASKGAMPPRWFWLLLWLLLWLWLLRWLFLWLRLRLLRLFLERLFLQRLPAILT